MQDEKREYAPTELYIEALGIENMYPNFPQYKKKEILKNITNCTDEEANKAFKKAWDKMYY